MIEGRADERRRFDRADQIVEPRQRRERGGVRRRLRSCLCVRHREIRTPLGALTVP